VTAASAVTAAAASLTKVLLRALLNVGSFVAVATSFSGPREVTDTVAATVLGIMGLLVVLPAALAVNNRGTNRLPSRFGPLGTGLVALTTGPARTPTHGRDPSDGHRGGALD